MPRAHSIYIVEDNLPRPLGAFTVRYEMVMAVRRHLRMAKRYMVTKRKDLKIYRLVDGGINRQLQYEGCGPYNTIEDITQEVLAEIDATEQKLSGDISGDTDKKREGGFLPSD